MAHNKLIIWIITCFYVARLIRFLIEDKKAKSSGGTPEGVFVIQCVKEFIYVVVSPSSRFQEKIIVAINESAIVRCFDMHISRLIWTIKITQ